MAKPQITLYLDVISPFAYIAYHILRTSSTFAQCDITYVPVLLGGIMKTTGNRPPMTIKNKDKWISQERIRWATYFNVPISADTPSPFPQPTVNAQRALCYVQKTHPAKLTAAFDALYRAFWIEGQTINDLGVIAPALERELGKSLTDEILAGIKSDAAKTALIQNTDKAVEDGCFGLPYFVATNTKGQAETYWGVDHLGMLIDHLGLEVKRKEGGFRALL